MAVLYISLHVSVMRNVVVFGFQWLTCICEPNTVLLQASSVRLIVSMASIDVWICVLEGRVVPLSALVTVVLAVR